MDQYVVRMATERPRIHHRYVRDTTGTPTTKHTENTRPTKLEVYLKEVGDMQLEEQEAWYETLERDSPYSKRLNLARKHQREVRIKKRSKKWWDKDLKSQLLKVRGLGRGAQGEGRRTAQPEKWQKWRKEKTKMRKIVRMKKRTCWEKFLEENGQKNA